MGSEVHRAFIVSPHTATGRRRDIAGRRHPITLPSMTTLFDAAGFGGRPGDSAHAGPVRREAGGLTA
jgi:hypothetical protein